MRLEPIGCRPLSYGTLVVSAVVLCGCGATLKTLDLQPEQVFPGAAEGKGAQGACTGPGNPPPITFFPAAGEVTGGFDDFFKPGAPPFPCDVFRDDVFRGGVKFDVSKFNSIVNVELLFDTDKSAIRFNGQTAFQQPPTSWATEIGLATLPFSQDGTLPQDNEAGLVQAPGGVDVNVSSQVRQWLNGTHANNGFVIWGPNDIPTKNDHPTDNNAEVSWYSNFRLRVTYDPSKNPNAPQ
jgi:hypothetical protein